jgi:predicted nuclease of predicted toxin-antitoxin system
MEILADESIDRQTAERLRQDQHTVWYIAKMHPGVPDDEVLALANRETAVLLTADRDFGELVFRQRRLSAGIVLVRLAGMSPANRATLVARVIGEYGNRLSGTFTVITPGTVRIRQPFGE